MEKEWWAEKDSNLRSASATDLQSVPFGHLGIYPHEILSKKADERSRTPDQLITNQLLYQLSYVGEMNLIPHLHGHVEDVFGKAYFNPDFSLERSAPKGILSFFTKIRIRKCLCGIIRRIF